MQSEKPGIRTSEFWLSLTAVIIGAVLSSGLLGSDEIWSKALGAIAAALAALGYSASRGKVKARAVLLCIACMFVASSATAQQILVISGDNTYQLMTPGADGAQLTKFDQIVRLNGNGPQPPPPDPDDDTVAEQIDAWADEINDSTTRLAMAKIYELVGERYKKGTVDIDEAFEEIRKLTDAVLAAQNAKDKWQPWRDNVSQLITRLDGNGQLDSKVERVAFFEQVSEGLANGVNLKLFEAIINADNPVELAEAVFEPGLFDNINIADLIRLIELILQLVGTFS